MKVELDLSNYAKNSDLNNATGVDTSSFANKTDLTNLKTNVDDKLVGAPVDLSKLSNVLKMMSIKKGVYNAKIKNIEDKILYITSLVAKTTLNAKIN